MYLEDGWKINEPKQMVSQKFRHFSDDFSILNLIDWLLCIGILFVMDRDNEK